MLKLLLALSCIFLLSACSSEPLVVSPEENSAAPKQEQHQDCAANPELAKQWGQCNVQKRIAEKIPDIKACYDKQLKKDDQLHGGLVLKILLKNNGKVRVVKILEGSLQNKFLSDCLISNIRKIQFAKPPKGEEAAIVLPFTLDQVR